MLDALAYCFLALLLWGTMLIIAGMPIGFVVWLLYQWRHRNDEDDSDGGGGRGNKPDLPMPWGGPGPELWKQYEAATTRCFGAAAAPVEIPEEVCV